MSLLVGKTFPKEAWKALFLRIFYGKLDARETKSLLLLLAKKGEDATELCGCLEAVRRVESLRYVSLPYLVDVCGTGGDGSQSFNVSTVSSFVLAGAGAYVAKHGNRAVSSGTGSSDLMEALGVRIDVPYGCMLEALHKCHLGYFHAPLYHPSFNAVQKIRRELGVRTLFNLLGPLVNPVEVQYQMIGVSRSAWMNPLAEGLKQLKRRRGAIVRSHDGLDELSTGAVNDIFYMEAGRIRRARLEPRKFGFAKARKEDYQGGDLGTNLKIALGIIENRLRGPQKDIVLLNSGYALWLTGRAKSIREGIERCGAAIRTGRALEVLKSLRHLTRKRGRNDSK